MASESLPTEWSWISCSIKAIKARCHYPVSPPPNKKNASHGLKCDGQLLPGFRLVEEVTLNHHNDGRAARVYARSAKLRECCGDCMHNRFSFIVAISCLYTENRVRLLRETYCCVPDPSSASLCPPLYDVQLAGYVVRRGNNVEQPISADPWSPIKNRDIKFIYMRWRVV